MYSSMSGSRSQQVRPTMLPSQIAASCYDARYQQMQIQLSCVVNADRAPKAGLLAASPAGLEPAADQDACAPEEAA
jgi:hypothetical protein